jgi:hypothetical protein
MQQPMLAEIFDTTKFVIKPTILTSKAQGLQYISSLSKWAYRPDTYLAVGQTEQTEFTVAFDGTWLIIQQNCIPLKIK